MNIEEVKRIAANVDLLPELRTICVPDLGRIIEEKRDEFPPLYRSLQNYPDWWKLQGTATPKGFGANLSEYYAIGYAHRPYLIAALGVGYGDALMAFAKGSRAAGVPNATVNGYDDETGRPGTLEWCRQAFTTDRVPYNLGHCNARQYDQCGIPLRHIDLYHLNQHANLRDTAKDLELVLPALSPRGVIVVDEVDADTWNACVRFGDQHGFKYASLDTARVDILYR